MVDIYCKIFKTKQLKIGYDKNLKLCSKNPLTGSSRDGYCKPIYSDLGNHLVCSKTDKQFLNYTFDKSLNLIGDRVVF